MTLFSGANLSIHITVLVHLCLFALSVSQDVAPQIENKENVLYVNERAVFKCVVRRSDRVLWFLNDTSPPRYPVEPYMARVEETIWYPRNKTSFLTMDASPETNNTRILCQAFTNENVGYNSPTIVLSVQGVLSSPGVTFVNDSQSVNITLDKPYCLPHAVISHYGSEVHVPNQNKTVMTNFTNPAISFIFSEHNISRCESQYINISLCAYNRAGEGEFSPAVEVFVPSDMDYCDQLLIIGPKDVDCSLIYLLGASVAVLVAASVLLVFLCACIVVKRNSTDQEKSIGDMTQNASYIATIPMKQNKAYEETPHMYEEVKILPYYNPAEA